MDKSERVKASMPGNGLVSFFISVAIQFLYLFSTVTILTFFARIYPLSQDAPLVVAISLGLLMFGILGLGYVLASAFAFVLTGIVTAWPSRLSQYVVLIKNRHTSLRGKYSVIEYFFIAARKLIELIAIPYFLIIFVVIIIYHLFN